MAVESRCSAAEQECCSSSNPNHSTVESLYIAGHHRHVAELGFEWLFAIVQHRVGVDDGDGDGGMSATFEWVGASVVVRKVADDLFGSISLKVIITFHGVTLGAYFSQALFSLFRKRQHPSTDLIGQGLMRFLGVDHGPVGDGERRVRIVDVLLRRVAQNPSEMAKVNVEVPKVEFFIDEYIEMVLQSTNTPDPQPLFNAINKASPIVMPLIGTTHVVQPLNAFRASFKIVPSPTLVFLRLLTCSKECWTAFAKRCG